MAKEPKEMTLEERQIAILERQLAIQEQQADNQRESNRLAAEQAKQTRQPNKRGPEISVFNPQGNKDYPMPELAFDVLAPWPMSKGKFHPLTVEEVKLMNRVKPGEVKLSLLDDTTVPCSIIARKNGTTGQIEMIAFMGARDSDNNGYVTLFSKERRHQIPTMVKLLHQVLDQQGTDYSDILTMAQIHKRIALPENHPEHLPVSVGE